ncbi:MAG: CapA family protein [Chloroflexi bacterium]|nr:CapA family protein [Chloroflexota bacterium]
MTKGTKELLSLVAVGDIYIKRDDAASIMAKIDKYTKPADFVFGNLEAPFTDRGRVVGAVPGRPGFRSKPSAIFAVSNAGFNAVGMANNHALKFGPEGLLHTIEVVEGAGIAHAGAGKNIAEAHKPAIVERKGTRVAMLSYSSVVPANFAATNDSPGIAVVRLATSYAPHPRVFEVPGAPATAVTIPDQGDVQAMVRDIKDAKATADIVVLSWHWGISQGYRDYVPYQIELGHLALDSGADLILGTHPHEPLGIEVYKGKAICYSLGNFAMELAMEVPVYESFMLRCQIADKRIQRVAFLPVRMKALTPEIVDTKRGADIVEMITRQSVRFGTKFTVEPEEVVIHT